jgi:hypothetical protein
MLLAIYLILKNKALSGSISMALSILAKLFAVALIPLYLRRIGIRNVLACMIVVAAAYVPFFIFGHTGVQKVFAGLGAYSAKWNYNGSIFIVVQSIFDTIKIGQVSGFFMAKLITGVTFIAIVAYLSLKKYDEPIALLRRSFCVLAALFLLSPVGEPWYFCWAIPFLCFFPYRSFLLLSWLLIFSYISFGSDLGSVSLGRMELPILNLMQYVPFFLFFAWEMITRKKTIGEYVEQ